MNTCLFAQEMTCDISWAEKNGYNWVKISGDLYVDSCSLLENELEKLIGSSNGPVVFDLSDVEYTAACGLWLFIRIYKRYGGDKHWAICCDNPSIKGLFFLTGISRLYRIYRNPEEAQQALQLTGT